MIKNTNINKGYTITELMITLAVVGIISALAIPAYQDYVTRAQVAEGFSLLAGAKTDVEDYAALHGVVSPAAFAEKNYGTDIVKKISLNSDGQLEALFSDDLSRGIAGQRLFLIPSATIREGAEKNIVWSCSGTMDAKYLPAMCGEVAVVDPTNPGGDGGNTDNPDPGGPKGPVQGTFDYNMIGGTLVNGDGNFFYGRYEDGKFYYGANELSSEFVGEKGVDENGNTVYYYKYNDHMMDFVINPDGSMHFINPEPDNPNYTKSTTNYPSSTGGGVTHTIDSKRLNNNPNLYVGEIMAIGQIKSNGSFSEGYNTLNQREPYGMNWPGSPNGYDSFRALGQATNDMALLYQNPTNYSHTSKGPQSVAAFNSAVDNFKKEVEAVKARNGGNYPADFPQIYRDTYEFYNK